MMEVEQNQQRGRKGHSMGVGKSMSKMHLNESVEFKFLMQNIQGRPRERQSVEVFGCPGKELMDKGVPFRAFSGRGKDEMGLAI